MPRRARILAGGYPVHVILRGIDRAAIFFEDEDRRFFLDALGMASHEASVAVHAYVLMTNHLHLLMTAERTEGIPKLMKQVAQGYAQRINRCYRRTGGLFEGRYRSALIEADRYLLACYRYIELNPVRASLVVAPGDYPWSSYRANALGSADLIVRPHARYMELADIESERLAAYRRLFEDALGTELLECLREGTNGGFVVGSQQFERQIAAMVGRRTWRGSPGRPRKENDISQQGELPV
ncbi:Transposase [Thiorhodovibrio winogradskyi]|uniref:Transposase n=1 Tax=Thiorhodovibrio winogradskyi TaxID=77007 RepID=A0ABZ0S7A6_9GAMM|nr:transposase [Thiorhodovibrio winogradskyi]